MKQTARSGPYQARKEELIVERLADEVLVYDLKRHKAHCLNRTAALVWEQCDGRKSEEDLAAVLENRLGEKVEGEVVKLALAQLDRAHLLERLEPSTTAVAGMSRRELLKRVGLAAAVTLPLVTSVMSPTPAQAATCKAKNVTCTSSLECCSKVCIGGKCL